MANNNKAGRGEENLYRALFESENEAVLLFGEEQLIDCNQKSLELLGYAREQIIGRHPYAFSPERQPDGEDSRGKMREMVRMALEGEQQSFPWTYARFDGSVIDAEVGFTLVEWEGKKFLKAVVSDVRDRNRSKELYRIFAHNAPLGIYILRDGKFVFVNPRFRECVGYSEKELIGRDALSLVHPEDREKVRLNAIEMLKRRRTIPYEFRTITKGGEIRWIMETVIPIYFDEKREVLGNHMDISDNKRAAEILRESEKRYRTILENIEEGYYELDADGRFNFFNDSCRKIFGYNSDELMGMNCRDCTGKENWERVGKVFDGVMGTLKPDRVQDWVIIRKDGFKRHIEASLALIHDADGKATGIRGIMRDVTERKKAEETITFMAYHDALTGLPNRVLFNDRLSLTLVQARRNRQKFTLMMLDLDKFKDINDTLGHQVGDQLLQGVGNRLRSRLRKGDTVARMGGDEFMLLFPDIKQAEDCLIVAQKIVESFRRPFCLGGHELFVTISIGIAIYPDDGTDSDALQKHADASMYEAKIGGRNNFKRNVCNG